MSLVATVLEAARTALQETLPFVLEALFGAALLYGALHGGKRAVTEAKWDLFLLLLAAMGGAWIWADLTPRWIGWALALGAGTILLLPPLLGFGGRARRATSRFRGENN